MSRCPICHIAMSLSDEMLPSLLHGNEYRMLVDDDWRIVCADCTARAAFVPAEEST